MHLDQTMLQSDRRKFRSQTSDNMDRWKIRGGQSQKGEEQRRLKKRNAQKKTTHAREKVEKSRFTRFFQ